MYSHFWSRSQSKFWITEKSLIYWINDSDKGFDSKGFEGSVLIPIFMESFSSNKAIDSCFFCIIRSGFFMYRAISISDWNDFYWDRLKVVATDVKSEIITHEQCKSLKRAHILIPAQLSYRVLFTFITLVQLNTFKK